MKTISIIVLTSFISFNTCAQEDTGEANIFSGLLNVFAWIDNLSKSIDNITERQSLKRVGRELAYISSDINDLTKSKRALVQLVTAGEFYQHNETTPEMKQQISRIKLALKGFEKRFHEVNKLVPAEFKTEKNPLTQNIDNSVWQKEAYIDGIVRLVQGQSAMKNNEQMISNAEKAIALSVQIEQKINQIKAEIDRKVSN